MTYSIGITTFKRRQRLLRNLVSSIRRYTNRPILITVNSDYKTPLDPEYVKQMLAFCSGFDNVLPTFFPAFSSLAKMWNTLIVNAATPSVLILNDDILLDDDVFAAIPEEKELLLLNGGWSHFLISKRMARSLNFFDERLLAYGEEDGDMTWKYINLYGESPPTFAVAGIRNLGEGYRNNTSRLALLDIGGQVFRPAFNREFLFKQMYEKGGTISGMFGEPHRRVIEDEQQYPYEAFKEENGDRL